MFVSRIATSAVLAALIAISPASAQTAVDNAVTNDVTNTATVYPYATEPTVVPVKDDDRDIPWGLLGLLGLAGLLGRKRHDDHPVHVDRTVNRTDTPNNRM